MSRFDEFWEQWPRGPRKVNRKGCQDKWQSRKLDEQADAIMHHVRWSAKNNDQWKGGFVPMPLTYLNQDRWLDGTFETKAKGNGAHIDGPMPDEVRRGILGLLVKGWPDEVIARNFKVTPTELWDLRKLVEKVEAANRVV